MERLKEEICTKCKGQVARRNEGHRLCLVCGTIGCSPLGRQARIANNLRDEILALEVKLTRLKERHAQAVMVYEKAKENR